jgi:hypothetical protein
MTSVAWFLVVSASTIADRERRGLHDKVAHTVVLQAP